MKELSLNILDIAQNSISANATIISIKIIKSISKNTLAITIKDNGKGMSEEQLRLATDPFYTTRKTRNVGLGISLFKMHTELTGGIFNISSCLGHGTEIKSVLVLNHIDRMPLGDMASTVCTLVQCNPSMDFIYEYIVDDKKMIANTIEFRKILGDIPLNSPQVIEFLREYINDNTYLIDGGVV